MDNDDLDKNEKFYMECCKKMTIKEFLECFVLMSKEEKHLYKFTPMDIVKIAIRQYNDYIKGIDKLNYDLKFGLVCGYIRFKDNEKIPISFATFIPTLRRLIENDEGFKKHPRSLTYFKADDEIRNLIVFLVSIKRLNFNFNEDKQVKDVFTIKMIKLCNIEYPLYDSDEDTENDLQNDFGGENFDVLRVFQITNCKVVKNRVIKIKQSIIKKIDKLDILDFDYENFELKSRNSINKKI